MQLHAMNFCFASLHCHNGPRDAIQCKHCIEEYLILEFIPSMNPGRNGPVSGGRLENWRDGSEDAELFMQLPLATRQGLIRRVVKKIGEWWDDAELLEKVRREAAKAVMEL
jgi:hypothetical protein